MRRAQAFFPQGVNMYVPKMGYAAGQVHGQPAVYSLGTPAVAAANNIAAAVPMNDVANTITALTAWTADSPYGRTIRLTPSGDPGAIGGTIEVRGADYLGQPMAERFSGANGSTAIVYGKKAFYRIDSTKNITASTNATTWAIGTGLRLGLPYKGDVVWARENGVLVPIHNRPVIEWVDRDAAIAVAGGTMFVRAPFPGYVKTLYGVPMGGGGAVDPVITVELGGVAITGLTVTIDTSNTAGLEVSDTPTTPGYSANNRFIAGGKIEIVAAAAAGAFGDRVGLELQPTQFLPADTTDPATTLTGDAKGTYESLAVFDDTIEFEVALIGDPTANASGNGGLHGIKQVAA